MFEAIRYLFCKFIFSKFPVCTVMYIYITPSPPPPAGRWCGGNECLADLRQRLLIRPAASLWRCIALFCCLNWTRHQAVYGAAVLNTVWIQNTSMHHTLHIRWLYTDEGRRPWPFPPLHHDDVAASIRCRDQASQAAALHSSGESAGIRVKPRAAHCSQWGLRKVWNIKAPQTAQHNPQWCSFTQSQRRAEVYDCGVVGCGVVSVQWSWWRELFTGSLTFITVE